MQTDELPSWVLPRPKGERMSSEMLQSLELRLLLARRVVERANDGPILGNQPSLPPGLRKLQPPPA